MVITCWVVLLLLLNWKTILLFPEAKLSGCYNISYYYFNATNVLNHWLIVNSHSMIIINKSTIYIYSLNTIWLLSAIVRSLSAHILMFSYILLLTSVHLDILRFFCDFYYKTCEISPKTYGVGWGETFPCYFDFKWSEITAREDRRPVCCYDFKLSDIKAMGDGMLLASE